MTRSLLVAALGCLAAVAASAAEHAGHDAAGTAGAAGAAGAAGMAGTAAGMVTLPDAAATRYQPGPPNLPRGTRISLVAGDPAKEGPFVLRLIFPANTVIAPHTHSKPETLTVLSGSVFHQHGETLDKTAGQELRAGGFVSLPQDMPHALWTTDGPVEVQVNGTGPFGLNYIDPKDDPSR